MADGVAALSAYAADVRSGAFPSEAETCALAPEVEAEVVALYSGASMSP